MESFSLKNRKMIEQAAGMAVVGLLVFFCLLVLKPFLSAMLWAAILVFATWPVYGFVKRRLTGGRPALPPAMTLWPRGAGDPLWMLAASSLDMAAGPWPGCRAARSRLRDYCGAAGPSVLRAA